MKQVIFRLLAFQVLSLLISGVSASDFTLANDKEIQLYFDASCGIQIDSKRTIKSQNKKVLACVYLDSRINFDEEKYSFDIQSSSYAYPTFLLGEWNKSYDIHGYGDNFSDTLYCTKEPEIIKYASQNKPLTGAIKAKYSQKEGYTLGKNYFRIRYNHNDLMYTKNNLDKICSEQVNNAVSEYNYLLKRQQEDRDNSPWYMYFQRKALHEKRLNDSAQNASQDLLFRSNMDPEQAIKLFQQNKIQSEIR